MFAAENLAHRDRRDLRAGVEAKALCEIYAAPPELTEVLVGLARETRAKGWWQAYGDAVPEWFEPYVGLEAAAERLRHYDGELVPGLLQTRPYMDEMIRIGWPEWSDDERERRVELRMRRQRLLTRRVPDASRFEFILSEAVLRRPLPDHAAMVEQLRHLAAVNEQRNVSLRVLPLAAGPHAASGAGAFVILDFPPTRRKEGEPTTVYQEGPTGALYLDKPAEIARFEAIWNDLAERALPERESTQVIYSFAGERR